VSLSELLLALRFRAGSQFGSLGTASSAAPVVGAAAVVVAAAAVAAAGAATAALAVRFLEWLERLGGVGGVGCGVTGPFICRSWYRCICSSFSSISGGKLSCFSADFIAEKTMDKDVVRFICFVEY